MESVEKTGITVHKLKTWPRLFEDVWNARKSYEVRRNDRSFAVGDHLVLEEWSPDTERYTGRIVCARVCHMLHDYELPDALQGGYCVLGIEPHRWADRGDDAD